MNLLTFLFGRQTMCPRCMGKGEVDAADIERLKRQHFWVTGRCAYCNGKGKVPEQVIAAVPADTAYLTTDLPASERRRLLKGHAGTWQRAQDHEAWTKQINK